MRSIIALCGAAVLAAAGLAGSADASDINAQGDIEFATTGPHGTGVTPDPVTDTDAWFDFVTTGQFDESLDDLAVVGCVGPSNTSRIVFVSQYGASHEVPATGMFRTGDPNVSSVVPDTFWDVTASGQLNSNDYHLVLAADLGTINESGLTDAANGNPHPDCVNSLPPMSS